MSCNQCKENAEIKLTWMFILSIEILITSIVGHVYLLDKLDRKSTRLNSSHVSESRMPSSA